MTNLTAPQLRELLHYDPSTGIFTWLVAPSNNVLSGAVAGSDMSGYRSIRVLGERYKAHRLAWLYMTGEWPDRDIDHKDGDRGNNKWENLRQATESQNMANARISKKNTSGYKGVIFDGRKGSWVARITIERRKIYIGSYQAAQEAGIAYYRKAKQIFGEFARSA